MGGNNELVTRVRLVVHNRGKQSIESRGGDILRGEVGVTTGDANEVVKTLGTHDGTSRRRRTRSLSLLNTIEQHRLKHVAHIEQVLCELVLDGVARNLTRRRKLVTSDGQEEVNRVGVVVVQRNVGVLVRIRPTTLRLRSIDDFDDVARGEVLRSWR